jgi:hypothetical protein
MHMGELAGMISDVGSETVAHTVQFGMGEIELVHGGDIYT